jgi:fructokinase
MGARAMTITLGEKGTFVSTSLVQKIVPTIEVVSVDTTGAGDAFIGCLLQQLSLSGNASLIWEDAELLPSLVKIANTAGAITTTNFGAITALPTADQLRWT